LHILVINDYIITISMIIIDNKRAISSLTSL